MRTTALNQEDRSRSLNTPRRVILYNLYFFILCIVSESLRVHLILVCVIASHGTVRARPSGTGSARRARVCMVARDRVGRESGQNSVHVSLFLTHLFCPPRTRGGCTGARLAGTASGPRLTTWRVRDRVRRPRAPRHGGQGKAAPRCAERHSTV